MMNCRDSKRQFIYRLHGLSNGMSTTCEPKRSFPRGLSEGLTEAELASAISDFRTDDREHSGPAPPLAKTRQWDAVCALRQTEMRIHQA